MLMGLTCKDGAFEINAGITIVGRSGDMEVVVVVDGEECVRKEFDGKKFKVKCSGLSKGEHTVEVRFEQDGTVINEWPKQTIRCE